MARVNGPSRRELDARGDELAARTSRAIESTLRAVTARVEVEELNRIRTIWRDVALRALVPRLYIAWDVAVAGVRGQLEHLTARKDATVAAAVFEIPKVSSALAEAFLATAVNRLVGIGDDVWDVARAALLDGMREGEGVAELRDRIMSTAPVSARRAAVIARTEVNSAMNNGAYEQMKTLDLPTIKEWIATDDARTRESHAEVDGEEIAGDAKFIVGGFPMDHPHDLNGPPGETINCRCTLAWEIDFDALDEEDDEIDLDDDDDDDDDIFDDEFDDDYDDDLLAAVSFHLPGKHNQKTHGRRHGKSGSVTPTAKSAASLSNIINSDAMTKLLDDPASFDYSSKKSEDRLLSEIIKQRGFDAKPTLVDSLPPGSTRMGRAVTDRKFAEQFLTGDYFAGKGQFGNGTYFLQTNDASNLSKTLSLYGDHQVNAALKSNARTTTRKQVEDEMKTLVADAEQNEKDVFAKAADYIQRGDMAGFQRDYGRAQRRTQLLRDPGRVAALLGYDAIFVTPDQGDTEVVVLNRGAVQAERSIR